MNHKSIRELAKGLEEGKWKSVDLVRHCLEMIDTYDTKLNSIAEVDENAIDIAAMLDEERKAKGPRSILHGIPIAVKDNICTKGMHTTAGSLALADLETDFDAPLIQALKDAGMIVMAKANLSEFAYFMSRENMPSGYSSRGGQVVHPYKEGFDPSGSSSGSAVAVAGRIFPVTIGTETNGSLASPSKSNAIVTMKPTLNLISQEGIIPISHMQDCAGPMAKSVEDCALLMEALTHQLYKDDIQNDLQGMRIGLLRYQDYPYSEKDEKNLLKAKEIIHALGGESVDVYFNHIRVDSGNVLQHEFKYGLNAFLKTVEGKTKMTCLKDIIDFNNVHKETCLRYGQSLLLESEELSGDLSEETYASLRKKITKECQSLIDTTLEEKRLDCILTMINTGHAPIAGYPLIVIPAEELDEEKMEPTSYVFWASAHQEHVLFKVASAIEKALGLNACPSYLKKG